MKKVEALSTVLKLAGERVDELEKHEELKDIASEGQEAINFFETGTKTRLVSTGKHTPGPWQTALDNDAVYIAGETMQDQPEEGRNLCPVIAKIVYAEVQGGQDQAETNARLIAAAPELLEALVGLLDLAENEAWSGGIIDTAREAIAKATGGAS